MVEQVDRDAAESFYEGPCTRGLLETILSSHRIAAEARAMEKAAKIVEAFAKHRTTSLAAQDLVDCETCCGNGEVVTDWERYKHPHDGDVGDEAVADCPDCDGNGKIEVPSLAAQDGLVEALEYMLRVFDETNANDYEDVHLMVKQSAKITSIADCRQALSAIKGDKS